MTLVLCDLWRYKSYSDCTGECFTDTIKFCFHCTLVADLPAPHFSAMTMNILLEDTIETFKTLFENFICWQRSGQKILPNSMLKHVSKCMEGKIKQGLFGLVFNSHKPHNFITYKYLFIKWRLILICIISSWHELSE